MRGQHLRDTAMISTSDKPGLHGRAQVSRLQLAVALLGGLVLFLDGFDTQVVSHAAPAIAREWHLPAGALGPILSSALRA